MNSVTRAAMVLLLMFFGMVAQAQHEGHQMPPKKEKAKPPAARPPAAKPKKPAAKSRPAPRTPSKKPAAVKPQAAPQPAHHHPPAEEVPAGGHAGHEAALPVAEGPRVVLGGRVVTYHLYITDTVVNFTGKRRHAYAINGTIPGPDLVFTEGDTAEIYLHNMLQDEETSLHWHGVILPNRFDGVPYLTTKPIHPGDVHLYRFPVHQNGTYWYHSHSKLQEQAGIYGALIFHKREGQQTQRHPGDAHAGHGAAGAASKTADPHAGHDMKGKPATPTTADPHAGHVMPGADISKKPAAMPADAHAGHSMTTLAPAGDGSYTHEHTVILSEWTDEKPEQVQRRLRTANDWYAIRKGSVQSYAEAIAAGHFGTKLLNEWKRMHAMDVSDVYYDKFLINGRPESTAPQYKKGDRVRLRLVNAGGSSYFWVQYAGGKLTVIGNDGNDVMPIEVDRLIIGVSETYDVVVTIPDNMSYELRATPEDRTQAASLWLGNGMKMPAPRLPRLKYFEGMKMMNDMMKMNGEMKAMDMDMSLQRMDMNQVMYEELHDAVGNDPHAGHGGQPVDSSAMANMVEMQGATSPPGVTTLNYAMLRAPENTLLPDAPYKELKFELTGNMNRYVWSINGKILREWDKIRIEKGHNVRIIMFNNSMMRHPMHLHGHDFRVLNGQGARAPLKNVLDILPMEVDTIEFAGSQEGDWFFHCHILYHMMAGMGNVFSYNHSAPNPDFPVGYDRYNKFIRQENMFHFMAEVGLESNGSDGQFMIPGNRYELRTEWRIGIKPHHGREIETYIGRYLGKMQWWYPFIGFDYHKNNRENEISKNAFGQLSNQSNRKAFVAGIEYVLPMLVRAQARVDSKGKLRFQLAREDVPLSPRLRLNALWNTDYEYMAGLRYILNKWLALSTHYDSDMGWGAGVAIIY